MKVLLECTAYPPTIGGMEVRASAIANTLVDMGHSVTVATSMPDSLGFLEQGVGTRGRTNEPQIHRCRSIRPPRGLSALGVVVPEHFFSACRHDEFDVCLSEGFGYSPSYMPLVPLAYRQKPWVLSAHAVEESSLPRWVFDSTIGLAVLRSATRVIATSHREARFLAELGADPQKIVTVPNGIWLSEFSEIRGGGDQRNKSQSDGPHILTVARLAEAKGIQYLLPALARLREKYPNATLRVIGPDAGYEASLRRIASNLGLSNTVVFEGATSRARLLRSYADADIFVLPSIAGEAQGIVLLEAMASGLPVVGTDVGGIPETVEDGVNGVIVPPRDSDGLARAVEQMLSSPSASWSMGEANRKAVTRYSWANVVAEIEKVMRSAVDEFSSS